MNRLLSLAVMAGALVVAACGNGNPSPVATAAPTIAPVVSQAPESTPPESTPPESTPSESMASEVADLVGIALPTTSSARWIADGDNLVKALTALGYDTDLQYAEDDGATQASQVESMVSRGAKVLVIAAVDGSTLADTLQRAADAGIRTLAYDRLIHGSANVDYYTTFDSFRVGVLQATSIERALDLKSARGRFNLELFAGPPDDTSAGFLFSGAMSVLQPYIDSGKLVVRSGETRFPAQVGTPRRDGAIAQARLDTILATYYADRRVDAVLAPYDDMSRGIIAALKRAGYYTAELPGPVVTGQDAELASVKSILAGEQTSTVFRDTRNLAAQAATMVDQMIRGETVEVNNTATYSNGVKVVPTFLLDMTLVTKDNVQAELVDSGYYTAQEVRP